MRFYVFSTRTNLSMLKNDNCLLNVSIQSYMISLISLLTMCKVCKVLQTAKFHKAFTFKSSATKKKKKLSQDLQQENSKQEEKFTLNFSSRIFAVQQTKNESGERHENFSFPSTTSFSELFGVKSSHCVGVSQRGKTCFLNVISSRKFLFLLSFDFV